MAKVRVTMLDVEESTSEPLTIDQAVEAIRAAWDQLRRTGKVKDGQIVHVEVDVRPREKQDESSGRGTEDG